MKLGVEIAKEAIGYALHTGRKSSEDQKASRPHMKKHSDPRGHTAPGYDERKGKECL